MELTSPQVYDAGLHFFGTIVAAVPDDAWGGPSPCDGWTALDVFGHVADVTDVGAKILRGEPFGVTAHDPPSSAAEADRVAQWNRLAAAAHTALSGVTDFDRKVESPMGTRTIRDGLAFPAADLYLHGWDLGTATGQEVIIPDDVIAFLRGMFTRLPDDAIRRPGIFRPARAAPAGATATDSLIAWTGRDPGWQEE